MAAFPFVPRGWAFCNGQAMSINQNQALFALLGTTFGGDGQTTFNLPDLRGRVPVHRGSGLPMGSSGGEAAVTLQVSQIPVHTHAALAGSSPAATGNPSGAYWAAGGQNAYGGGAAAALGDAAIGSAGGGQAHENMAPYQVVNFIIALQGIFPNRD